MHGAHGPWLHGTAVREQGRILEDFQRVELECS